MAGEDECRFRYRTVEANDFGLSIEEILNADDTELNQWCSLKRAMKRKSGFEEESERKYFQKKAKNEEKKKRIFQSIYGNEEEKG